MGDAGLRHLSLRGPQAYSKIREILLIMGARTTVLGRRVNSVQTTLPEAGAQVGGEPAAVSREWLPTPLAALLRGPSMRIHAVTG